jgi:predicted DNA-binding transcriptional regulator AlpA
MSLSSPQKSSMQHVAWQESSLAILLNVDRAAARVGLSVSTLNKMRLNGTGPRYAKLGRRVLYDIRDLEAWVAERKRNHTSEQF